MVESGGFPRCVLAVFAHPDDAELACGGALAGWAAAGASVTIVCVCRGDKGAAERVEPGALAALREAEGRAAAAQLGAEWHALGMPDGEIAVDRLRAEVVALVRRRRPDVVVAPDPTVVIVGSSHVNHRDHREIGWAVLDAVGAEAANPNYHPGDDPAFQAAELWLCASSSPDRWVDIEVSLDAKVAALRCHATQLGGGSELGAADPFLRELVVGRAAAEGRAGGVRFGEAFRRIVLVD